MLVIGRGVDIVAEKWQQQTLFPEGDVHITFANCARMYVVRSCERLPSCASQYIAVREYGRSREGTIDR